MQIERIDAMATIAGQLLGYELVLQYLMDEEAHKEVTYLISTNQLDELKRFLEDWENKKTTDKPPSETVI